MTRTPTKSRTFARPAGFTLLELLVAAAITAAMAAFIGVIILNVSTTWSRSTGRLGADAQARLALDQLELDLQGAQFRDDGNVWLAASILDTTGNATGLWTTAQTAANAKPTGANGSLVLTSASIADARFGLAGTWLRFFTTRRGSNDTATTATLADTASAPVAVGYQIIRRRSSTATLNLNTGYYLHRAEARPASNGTRPGVLESGFNITAAAYSTSAAATNNGTITGDPRSVRVPGSATNLDAILADNVIDFGLRAYVHDGNGGLRLIFPADAAGKPAGSTATTLLASLPAQVSLSGANFNQHFPDVVEVMIRVLTDEGALLIANLEKSPPQPATRPTQYPTNAAWWWAIAVEHSRVYTRRVILYAQPL